jgi:hypothetical protein
MGRKNLLKKRHTLLVLILVLLFFAPILESTTGMFLNGIETQRASEGKQEMLAHGGVIDSYEPEFGGSNNYGFVTNSIVINGTQTYVIANGTYTLDDTIIVEDTATLIIKNATVVFHTTDYTVIESHDNARVYIEDSVLEHSPWFYLLFHDSSIASVLRSKITEIVNRGSADVTVNNSTVSTVNSWDLSNFKLNGSLVSSIASYESSHTTMSNSSVGGIAIEESSDTVVSDSTINSIYLGFILDSNVSLTSMPTGFVGLWSLHENNTLEKAYVKFAIYNTWVGPWCIVAHDWSVVSITGLNTDDIYAQESSTVIINDSIIGDLYSVDRSVVHVFDTQLSWLEIDQAGYVNVFVINSTYLGISWIDWEIGNPRLYVGWYLDVMVVDVRGFPLTNANVKVYWENGTLLVSINTDDDGLARFVLYEKMINAIGTFPYDNYMVEVAYYGYTHQRVIKSITGNMKISVTPWICIYHHGLIYGIYTEWLVVILAGGRPIRIPID